ncbi:MAG: hypothetical protein ACRDDZ_11170 [Marinifilaceae bacterium]
MFRESIVESDSTTVREVTKMGLVKVPPSQVSLLLYPEDIKNLPPGSSYTAKAGQAGVRVEYRDSLVYITSTCDSLELIIQEQYREIERLQKTISERDVIIEKPPSIWERASTAIIWMAIGMALGFVIKIIRLR